MAAEAYPLAWPAGWPRAKGRMNHTRFSVLPEKALLSLLANLRQLRTSHVVVSSNCKLRNDGFPYSEDLKTTSHKDPGVAIYFQFKAKPMVMAQDGYNAPYANMRSLALAIEALRTMERHGGGHMMERSFAGFAQLPPPEGSAAVQIRPWRDVLEMAESYNGIPLEDQLVLAEAKYRKLARDRHPDASSGSADLMAELNLAIEAARAQLQE